jgi:DNA polymerase III gamma/tau subunit
MNFSDILGNDHIKKRLTSLLENNSLSNALLFAGPSGVGKFSFAKRLAYHLMYPNLDENNKIKIENNNHPDLHIYEPCGKTSMHLISSIRDLISEVHISAFEATVKVFIIKDASRMHAVSFNALLKTLEEPTFDSYIILLTDGVDEILPTIVSRCFKLNFNLVSIEEISNFLQNKFNKNPIEALAIAKISDGSIKLAKELIADEDYLKKRDFLLNILLKKNILNYLDFSNSLDELDLFYSTDKITEDNKITKIKKEINLLFDKIFYFFRDLHILKENIDEKNIFFFDKIEDLKKINLNNLKSIEKINIELEKSKLAVSRNIKLKVALENFFLAVNFI